MAENMDPRSQPALPVSPQAQLINVQMHARDVAVHPVFDQELTALQNASPSAPFAFFALALGAAIGFGTAAFTQPPSANNHNTFVALFFAAAVLTAYFAIRTYFAKRASDQMVKDIRSRPSGQVPQSPAIRQ